MKILGKNSLSSKVKISLNVLFVIISIIDIWVFTITLKIGTHIYLGENLQTNIFDLTIYLTIIISGIIALFIIYQFIKIFKNLENEELFSKENVKWLNNISIGSFTISIIYLILAILIGILGSQEAGLIYYIMVFGVLLAVIFIVIGIGIKILNEIYKKAIEYKEENDFTI